MIAITLLFICGILLLASEVFIPGAILGSAGALCLAAGTTIAFGSFGFSSGMLTGVIGLALACLTFWLEFSIMPKRQAMKRLAVNLSTSGAVPPPPADPAAVVGQTCVAATTLAPSGYVTLGERRYEAFCQSGHAEAGARLTVVGVNPFQLVVTQS